MKVRDDYRELSRELVDAVVDYNIVKDWELHEELIGFARERILRLIETLVGESIEELLDI